MELRTTIYTVKKVHCRKYCATSIGDLACELGAFCDSLMCKNMRWPNKNFPVIILNMIFRLHTRTRYPFFY